MRNTATFTRTFAAACIVAVAAVGCASSTEGRNTDVSTESPTSGSANPDDLSGTYTVTYDDGLVRTWTATSCGQGCADVEQTPKPFGAKAKARLNDNQWTIEVSSPTETECGDGTKFPGITTWTWDASTQKGSSRTEQIVDACGDPAGDVFDEHSFSLTKS